METRQAEEIESIMEVENFKLREDVSLDFVDMSQPLQTLFDECLHFISVNDFNV